MAKLGLKVNDRVYDGWLNVRVSRSMQQVAGSFDLELSQRWQGNPAAVRLQAGMECQVVIDDQPIMTGYIDSALPSYDDSNHSLSVSGRDRTADLVDCSAPPTQFRNMTFAELARQVCQPFGIEVVDLLKDASPFRKDYKSNDGDSAHELLEMAARARGGLLTTDGRGRLVITRAGQARAKDALVLGRNILSASGGQDLREVFSRYVLKSQHQASLFDDAERAAAVVGRATETLLKRYRPLTLIADQPLSPKECSTRVQWERDVRRARAQAITYRVRGWLQSDGTPWRPNLLVTVDDSYQGIKGDRLITDVNYGLDDGGEVVELATMEPAAFALMRGPEPEEH